MTTERKDKCVRCGTLAPQYECGFQMVRYGYSGPRMTLCSKCNRELISWIENYDEGETK